VWAPQIVRLVAGSSTAVAIAERVFSKADRSFQNLANRSFSKDERGGVAYAFSFDRRYPSTH
jgi:hypothetical protein